MKNKSSMFCAFALTFGTISYTHAMEVSFTQQQTDNTENIDSILSQLSSQTNFTSSLLKTSPDVASLANDSALIGTKTPSKNKDTDNKNDNMLSHLTLVASNSINKFKQAGRASWYGDKFHGALTASGERFNMNSMTAAHPSLPFNTLLKVTNKSNDKSVIVKVNDRGPFSSNRVLDLSYGAAKKIGLIKKGVANVIIERIDSP